MARKKTAAELQAEVKFLRQQKTSSNMASVAMQLIRWGGVCFTAWCMVQIVQALAGKRTVADIGFKMLAEVRWSETIAWVAGTGGCVYGFAQRKLRRDTVERLQARNQDLEKRVDPGRSSSNLTARGDTRPEEVP